MASCEKALLTGAVYGAFSLFPKARVARLVWKQLLGVFPLLPIGHLINVLYCAVVLASNININTYTHKPGTIVWAFSTLRPDFQGLEREATVFELLICIQRFYFSFIHTAKNCIWLKNFQIIQSFLLYYQQTTVNSQVTMSITFPHSFIWDSLSIQPQITTIFCVFWDQKVTTHTLVADSHHRYKISCTSDLTPHTLLGCNTVKVTDYTVEYDLKHAVARWEFKLWISV